YPKNDESAIRQVREIAKRGARFLVFPTTSAWWLTHYAGLRAFLDRSCRRIVDDPQTCVIYALTDTPLDAVQRTSEQPAVEVAVSDTQPPPPAITDERSRSEVPVRLIAFYLPQFHPIAENDAWWGKGFTEWTNVMRARPLFPGHYQPHMPGDLGFYDLRLADTREMQAHLARAHGIHGFCYYHYWFGGKLLLDRPFNEVL